MLRCSQVVEKTVNSVPTDYLVATSCNNGKPKPPGHIFEPPGCFPASVLVSAGGAALHSRQGLDTIDTCVDAERKDIFLSPGKAQAVTGCSLTGKLGPPESCAAPRAAGLISHIKKGIAPNPKV